MQHTIRVFKKDHNGNPKVLVDVINTEQELWLALEVAQKNYPESRYYIKAESVRNQSDKQQNPTGRRQAYPVGQTLHHTGIA
ncbi:hypothetical protein [Chrysiogenes arsenatis]|uniref:hypothetical protein n=1 Tax=Chrysiogenes arsenatis TaxID=309797 RepID=UPI000408AF50|nr:hypothetical protein [Chrysiogenes arsenatis]